jgi:hypothetical protein
MNFSTIIIVSLCLLLVVAVYYMLKFALDLIEIEDRLNNSISDIEKSYEVFDNISKKPVFFDSVEIKQCIQEIVNVRNVLLKITEDLREVSSNVAQKEITKNKELYETGRKEEDS